jgi:hypothetical protein
MQVHVALRLLQVVLRVQQRLATVAASFTESTPAACTVARQWLILCTSIERCVRYELEQKQNDEESLRACRRLINRINRWIKRLTCDAQQTEE